MAGEAVFAAALAMHVCQACAKLRAKFLDLHIDLSKLRS
jgi:hypothetical protein